MNLQTIRQQYPQYNDINDSDLASALHQKYYSDLPKEKIFEKLGLSSANQSLPTEKNQPFMESVTLGTKKRALGVAEAGLNIANSLGIAPEFVGKAKNAVAELGQDYANQGTGTGVKGAIGEILGDPLTAAGGATIPKLLAQGALMGFTSSTGNSDSTLVDNSINAGGGAAASLAGKFIGSGVNRVAQPVKSTLGNIGAAAVKKLEDSGVSLSAAQKTGSKALGALESVFSSIPMTSSAQNSLWKGQRDKFTQAALKEAGINAPDAGRQSLEQAKNSFTNEYQNITANNNLNIDNTLLQNVADIYQKGGERLGQDSARLVKSVANDIYNSGNVISGKEYQATRSLLTQKANATKDSFDSGLMKSLRNELDAAFERSLPKSQQGVMSDINKRYQAFKPIQQAMDSNNVDSLIEGSINPATLYNKVSTGAPLSNLADAGKSILRQVIPDSGTATRTMMQNLVTGAGLGLTGYGASSNDGYSPYITAAGTALAAPKAAQLFYNSNIMQQYLNKGLGKNVQSAAQNISKVAPSAAASAYSGNIAQPKESENITPAPVNAQKNNIQPQANNSDALLKKIAMAESGGNPNARNRMSSASGLFQFTDGTWASMVNKYGYKYGITLKDKMNPDAQVAMMQHLVDDNANYLRKNTGLEPNENMLYLSHFLGAQQAVKAIKSYGMGKDAVKMFPAAAKANKNIFYKNGKPVTVEKLYSALSSKIKKT
jgi:Transglycosylase SLT domain